MIVYTARGNQITLGKELARGGEAVVYRIQGTNDVIAKRYNSPTTGYDKKLEWMIANPPADPNQATNHVSIAWPRDVLYDTHQRLVGITMPFIPNAIPLLGVFNPRLRAKKLTGFNWFYLHRTAQNLAAALAAIHARGYVVGDLNESNILVTPTALVTLIDTDSFQVQKQDHAQIITYPCPVGKAEYTPPELQGQVFRETIRQAVHDRFGLGVLIFQILMDGSHPFRGKWQESGDAPLLEEKIQAGWFPHDPAAKSKVIPPPNVRLDILHPHLATLVRRCFIEGHTRPDQRPTAEEWDHALEQAEKELVQCRNGHYYSGHLSQCPRCQSRAARRQQPLPAVPHSAPQPKPKPQPAPQPKPQPTSPVQPQPRPRPRPQQAVAKSGACIWWIFGIVTLLLVLVVYGITGFAGSSGDAKEEQAVLPASSPTATPIPPTATPIPPTATPIPPTATPIPPPATTDEWRNELQRRGTEMTANGDHYWRYVPAGDYRIGGWTADGDDENDAEAMVQLDEYWLAKYPVTVQQYAQFIEAGGYDNRDYWTDNGWEWKKAYDDGNGRSQPWQWDDERFNSDNQPVIGVTWYEATAFATWLHVQLADELPQGYRIRLPTEAQWEVACAYDADGNRHPYPWGEQDPTRELADFDDDGSDPDSPSFVGGRPAGASAAGVQDMVGSVWEQMTNSAAGYPAASGAVVADFATGVWDIPLRGGAWWSVGITTHVRCTSRSRAHPVMVDYGFRLVLSP